MGADNQAATVLARHPGGDEGVEELLARCRGHCWITGRDIKGGVCLRLAQGDVDEILLALRWTRWLRWWR